MSEYHKIQTVFKRDPETKYKTLLEDEFTYPEFEYLKNNEWVWTEKVDGTNIRIIFDGENLSFGGRTDRAQIPADLVNALNDLFLPLRNKLADTFTSGCVLYGEGYGAKIQKGGENYRTDNGFVLFDVRIGDSWLQEDNIIDIAETLGIDIVPVVGNGTLCEMIEITKSGFNSMWGDFKAEGIVARPKTELKTRKGERLITKIKYRDFK